MHSPFVFDFITKVMNDKTKYDEYGLIEQLRRQLLADQTILTVKDLGAGSVTGGAENRQVSTIAKFAAKPPRLGQLLFRMARYYRPASIIELGTSLGLSTAYLAKGNTGARVITMEGSEEIAKFAQRNFSKLEIPNIEIVQGNFDDTLNDVLDKIERADFVFVDGNHRKEPTLRYFNQLLPKSHNDSIFIFDDIHWSSEMEEAWKEIINHESVRASIDLFHFGIIFFRAEFLQKRNFNIIY